MNRLGLDIGKKRIGIAISRSPLAGNYETLYCKTWTKDISHIAEIVSKENIDEIVVGLPLNMDGTEGEMAEYVKKFCGMLKSKILAKIIYVDERLTSISADHIMHDAGERKTKKKGLIDQVAASLILQSYLDNHKGDLIWKIKKKKRKKSK